MTQPVEALWDEFRREPANAGPFRSLVAALRDGGDAAGLIGAYRERAAAAGEEERLYLHLTIAEALAPAAGDEASALKGYADALAVAPLHSAARATLREVFWHRGVWSLLEGILAEEAQYLADPGQRAGALVELARFRNIKLGDRTGAANAYLEALYAAPESASTFRNELAELQRGAPDEPAVLVAVAELARLDGDAGRLLSLLERQVELLAAGAKGERFNVLMDAAQVAGRDLGDWARAATHLAEAFRQEPGLGETIMEVAHELLAASDAAEPLVDVVQSLASELGDERVAVELLRVRAARAADPKERARLRFEAGEVLWNGGNRAGALDDFEEAAVADPVLVPAAAQRIREQAAGSGVLEGSPAARAEVEARVERLFRRTRQLEGLAALWRADLEKTSDRGARADLLMRLATFTHDDLAQPERCLEIYRQVAAEEPEGPRLNALYDALFALTREGLRLSEVEGLIHELATQRGSWSELLRLATDRLERATDSERVAELNHELGLIFRDRLDQNDLAAEHFARAAQLAPYRAEFLKDARQSLARLERGEEALALVDTELASEADLERRSQLLVERAELLWSLLQNRRAALLTLLDPFVEQGGAIGEAVAEPALAPLVAALHARFDSKPGEEAVRALLEEANLLRAPEYAQVVGALLAPERASDLGEGRRMALLQAADKAGVLSAERIEELAAWLRERKLWDRLAAHLERRLARAPAGQRRPLHEALVALYRDDLKDIDKTYVAWRGLLADAPDDLAAFESLVQFLRTHERFGELAAVYTTALESFGPVAHRETHLDLRRRQAKLCLERLGRADLAAQAHQAVLELEPLDPDALAFFAAHYAHMEDAASHYALLERTGRLISDPHEVAKREFELGELALDRLGHAEAARDHWERAMAAVEVAPQVASVAAARLDRLYESYDETAELVRVRTRRLEMTSEGDETLSVRLRELASAQEGVAAPAERIAVLERLLATEPSDAAELLERGADLAAEAGERAQEIDLLERLAEVAERPLEANLRLCHLYVEDGEARGPLLAALRRVMAQEAGHPEALDLAARLLRPPFEAPAEWRDLLLEQLEAAEGDRTRIEILLRLAEEAEALGALDAAEAKSEQAEGAVEAERTEDAEEIDEIDEIDEIEEIDEIDEVLDAEDDEKPEHTQQANVPRDWEAWALTRVLEIAPERRDVATRLSRHYEDRGDWREAVTIFESLFEQARTPARKADLLRRIGYIYEHQLSDVESAKAAYDKVTELEPEEVGALRARLRLSRQTNEYQRITELTGRVLELDPDAADLSELVHGAATVAVDELADAGAAIALLERLVEIDPLDTGSLERLGTLYEREGRWRDLADCLDRQAGLSREDQHRIDLWSRRAKLLEERLDDLDGAGRCFEDILQVHAGNRVALHALKRIHTAQGRWMDVLVSLSKLAQLDADPLLRSANLREAAAVYADKLENPAKAIALYRSAHEILPDDPSAAQAMAQLAEAHEMWEPYVDLLEYDAERAPTPDLQRERVEAAARIVAGPLDDPARAFKILHTRFRPSPREDELFESLVALCIQHQMWDRLEAIVAELVRATADPAAKVRLLHRLSDHFRDDASDPAQAFKALRVAWSQHPSEDTLAKMDALAEASGLWAEVDGFWESRWQGTKDADERVGILVKRADILERHLDRWEDALDQVVTAFRIAPLEERVTTPLFRLAGAHGLWEQVLKLFELLLRDTEEPLTQLAFLEQMTRISAEELKDPARAFEFAARAWRLRPEDEALRATLRERAVAAQNLEGLAAAFEWEAETRPTRDGKLEAWRRVAQLALEELRVLPRAVAAFTELYRVDPGRTETLDELEASLREAGVPPAQLVATLTTWLAVAKEARDRAEIFRRIARLTEELGLVEETVEAYRGVLGAEARDFEALERLAQLHREQGDWERVLRCLEQMQSLHDDADVRRRLFEEMASIHLEQGRPLDAVRVLRRRIEAFPDDDPQTERIVALYAQGGRAEGAVEFLEDLALTGGGAAANERLLGAAEIALSVGDLGRAHRLVHRVVNADEGHAVGWGLALRVALAGERWKEASEALTELARIAKAGDTQVPEATTAAVEGIYDAGLGAARAAAARGLDPAPAAARWLGAAALLQEHRLDLPQEALALWRRAHEAAPAWPLATLALARLLLAEEDPSAAAELARSAVEGLPSGRAEALPLRREALLLRARALDARGAERSARLDAYQAALEADPTSLVARERFGRLAKELGKGTRAIATYQTLGAKDLDERTRQMLLVEHAIALEDAGDLDGANESWDKALALPDPDELETGRRLALAALGRGNGARAASLIEGMLERLGDGDLLTRMWLLATLGQAAELEDDTARAQEAYTRAYALRPTDETALLGLARIAVQRGALALAGQYLGELRELELSPRADRDARRLEADVFLARKEPARAAKLFEALLEREDGDGTEIRAQLARIYLESGQEQRGTELLETVCEQSPPGEGRAAALAQLSALRLRKGDVEGAWSAIERSLLDDPGSADALRAAAPLAVRLGRHRDALAVASRLLQKEQDPARRAEIRVLAAAAAKELGKHDVAAEHYRAVCEYDPLHAQALAGYVEAMRRADGDASRLREFLESQLGRVGDSRPAIRSQLLRELGQVLASLPNEAESALEIYRELSKANPDDAEIWRARLSLVAAVDDPDVDEAALCVRSLAGRGHIAIEALRALRGWYGRAGRGDAAFVVTGLLAALQGEASSESAELEAAVRTAGEREPAVPSAEIWGARIVPDAPWPGLSARLAHCAQAAAVLGELPGGLAPHPLAEAFARVAEWCGAGGARLLAFDAKRPEVVNVSPPAVLCPVGWFDGMSEADRAFQLAALATRCRPELLMCAVLSELKYVAFHEAALEPLIKPDHGFGRDKTITASVRDWRTVFGQAPDLDPRTDTGVDRGELPSPAAWRERADAISLRAALLWSNSVEAAIRYALTRPGQELVSIGSLEDVTNALRRSARLRAIVSFALSEEYLALRDELGIARGAFAPAGNPA